jgi:lipid A ethanolaminephosphotransferase
LSVVRLKVALLAGFVFWTNAGVWRRLTELFSRQAWPELTVFVGLWLCALAGLGIAAFLRGAGVRWAWSFVLCLSAALGVLAHQVSGHHLSYHEVLLYWHERAFWGGAMELYSQHVVHALLTTVPGILGIVLPPGRAGIKLRAAALLPLLPACLITGLVVARQGGGTTALPEQYTPAALLAAALLDDPFADLAETRRAPDLPLSGRRPARHIVLVVDESVRPDFLDINLQRGLTPSLVRREDLLVNFGYAAAGNNCSLFSNLILRFGAVAPDVGKNLVAAPSIWAFARAAGYRSVYIDAQVERERLQNGMTLVERRDIDELLRPFEVPGPERDFWIADHLVQTLDTDQPQFVFINKRGAHFPYTHVYPPEAAVFSPSMQAGEAVGTSRERLVNAYKNAIHWNVDGFFQRLLAQLPAETVILYTSDHGQNLMDAGLVLQCNARDPHFLEGVVPILAITGSTELRTLLGAAVPSNRDRASHFEIFPTLLVLMGFEHEAVRARYGGSLMDPIERPQAFTYGSIMALRSTRIAWKQLPQPLRASVEASNEGAAEN